MVTLEFFGISFTSQRPHVKATVDRASLDRRVLQSYAMFVIFAKTVVYNRESHNTNMVGDPDALTSYRNASFIRKVLYI